jgi:hypothetical protein
MDLAYVSLSGRGATDALLATAVARLHARGIVPAGTVQTNPPCAGREKCDMDIHVLPDGPVLRISQDLGAAARGCRLDSSAWKPPWPKPRGGSTAPIFWSSTSSASRRRGPRLRPADRYRARTRPAGTGWRERAEPAAFEAFAGGLAHRLPADPDAIAGWAEGRIPRMSPERPAYIAVLTVIGPRRTWGVRGSRGPGRRGLAAACADPAGQITREIVPTVPRASPARSGASPMIRAPT